MSNKTNRNIYSSFNACQHREHCRELDRLVRERNDEIERLRARVSRLEEALRHTVDEVSWFVSRKPDLNAVNDMGRIWADVLNQDLDEARAALEDQT